MNKINYCIVLSIVFIGSLSCNYSSLQDCNVKRIKTLYTIPGVYEGKITGYSHYTLIKDYSRNCLDSSTMIAMAMMYADTISVDKPVEVLMLFNSDQNFIPNERSQVMSEINKNCLVVIGFDKKTNKPNDFIFYNSDGSRVYWGNRWLPNGVAK